MWVATIEYLQYAHSSIINLSVTILDFMGGIFFTFFFLMRGEFLKTHGEFNDTFCGLPRCPGEYWTTVHCYGFKRRGNVAFVLWEILSIASQAPSVISLID